jgi:hypothetical protein
MVLFSRGVMWFMHGNMFMVCQLWAAGICSINYLFSFTVGEQCGSYIMAWYTVERHVFLYDTYVKYISARK